MNSRIIGAALGVLMLGGTTLAGANGLDDSSDCCRIRSSASITATITSLHQMASRVSWLSSSRRVALGTRALAQRSTF